jgi:hypothetical protein
MNLPDFKNIPPTKTAYVSIISVVISYYAYCQYNGMGMFDFMSPSAQTWKPNGANGFQHK